MGGAWQYVVCANNTYHYLLLQGISCLRNLNRCP